GERHISHPSKHWTLEPRAIVLAYDRPGNARVAVGVAPVEFITVIEPNRTLVSGNNRRTPFQDFLGPVHPHVVVHPARQDHLFLSSVPQRIMSFSLLELLLAIGDGTAVARVLRERTIRPGFEAFEGIIVRVVADEVHRELASDNQLLQKDLFCGCRRRSCLHRVRYSKRSDVAKMQVRREAAGSRTFRMIPVFRIVPQAALSKVSEYAQGTLGSALPVLYQRNRAIEGPAYGEILIHRK